MVFEICRAPAGRVEILLTLNRTLEAIYPISDHLEHEDSNSDYFVL